MKTHQLFSTYKMPEYPMNKQQDTILDPKELLV
jgi:hypothetical protein